MIAFSLSVKLPVLTQSQWTARSSPLIQVSTILINILNLQGENPRLQSNLSNMILKINTTKEILFLCT